MKFPLARSNATKGRLPFALIALGSDGGPVSRRWLATIVAARGRGLKAGSSDCSHMPALPDTPRLESICRDFGDFIETTGAPVLAIGFILIAGLRGWPWIIGVMANG